MIINKSYIALKLIQTKELIGHYIRVKTFFLEHYKLKITHIRFGK
jgi:hypothetical protein